MMRERIRATIEALIDEELEAALGASILKRLKPDPSRDDFWLTPPFGRTPKNAGDFIRRCPPLLRRTGADSGSSAPVRRRSDSLRRHLG
jgi:hypothetical protein